MAVYLYIVRHGEAVADFSNDATRQLTEHGKWEAKRTGLWISTQVSQFDFVFCSPYVRARQTCEIIRQQCKQSQQVVDEMSQLIPSGSHQLAIDEMLAKVQSAMSDPTQDCHVLCVSHMPIVSYMIGELTSYAPVMSTAAVAKIVVTLETWSGNLETLIAPDQML